MVSTYRKQLMDYFSDSGPKHYRDLYWKIGGYIYNRGVEDQSTIEDILHQTLVIVIEEAPKNLKTQMFNDGKISSAFWRYIFKVVHNRLLCYERTIISQRRRIISKGLSEGATFSDGQNYSNSSFGATSHYFQKKVDNCSPEKIFEQAHRTQIIEETIGNLRKNYQEIIKLRYFDGESYKAIAEKLDISMFAARMRSMRAIKTLRKYFLRKKIDKSILLEK